MPMTQLQLLILLARSVHRSYKSFETIARTNTRTHTAFNDHFKVNLSQLWDYCNTFFYRLDA